MGTHARGKEIEGVLGEELGRKRRRNREKMQKKRLEKEKGRQGVKRVRRKGMGRKVKGICKGELEWS